MILSFSLVAIAAMQLTPPDWREVSSSPELRYYWDANSVTRTGDTVIIRLRRVPVPAVQGAHAYRIARVEIRCAAGQARVLDSIDYASDGAESGRDPVPTEFATIPPKSIAGEVRPQVCAPAAEAR